MNQDVIVVYKAINPITQEINTYELLAWQVIKCPEGINFLQRLTDNKFSHIPTCISQAILQGIDEYVKLKR